MRANTEAEKEKWRKEGRCFECDYQGHMARECPHKKRKALQGAQVRYTEGEDQDYSYEEDQSNQDYEEYYQEEWPSEYYYSEVYDRADSYYHQSPPPEEENPATNEETFDAKEEAAKIFRLTDDQKEEIHKNIKAMAKEKGFP